MWRVTLRGLQGHFLRFLLTASAVMLGVSFVAGTFVLRDSIDNSLSNLFSQAFTGTDVSVRGAAVGDALTDGIIIDPTGASSTTRPSVPLSLEQTLATVPGVARVNANIQGTAIIAGKDGLAVRTGGAPGLGFAYDPADPAFTLIEGSAPTGPSQVLVESSTLAKAGLQVGDRTVAVIGDQTRPVTIVGEVRFGSLFGATAVLLDDASARRAFARDGTVASISLTAAPASSSPRPGSPPCSRDSGSSRPSCWPLPVWPSSSARSSSSTPSAWSWLSARESWPCCGPSAPLDAR